MATTENKYTANGSDTQFVFTFPFLAVSDIKVSLNQVLTTAFTVTESTPTLITFNTAPANGTAVRIFRETDPDTTLSRFFSGSSIPAPDLNDNFDQALFINQELLNEFAEFVATGVVDDSVTTSKILDGAVVTSKLADNSVTTAKIVDANVTTAKVADAAITPAKLSIDYTEEAPSDGKQYARKNDTWSEVLPTTSSGDSPPSNPTDGLIWYDSDSGKSFVYYVDGDSSQWVELNPSWTGGIADDGVTTVKLLDGAVTTPKVADNAVTTAKILDANVTPAKLDRTYVESTAANTVSSLTSTGDINFSGRLTGKDSGTDKIQMEDGDVWISNKINIGDSSLNGLSSTGGNLYSVSSTSYAGYFEARQHYGALYCNAYGHTGSDSCYALYARSQQSSSNASAGALAYSINNSVYALMGYWSTSAYYGLYTNGAVAGTSFPNVSDERLKDLQGTPENCLDKLSTLNGYYYTWKDNSQELRANGPGVNLGLSAQEVQAVFPEVITENVHLEIAGENPETLNEQLGTTISVDYGKLVPALIEAIKELKVKVETLESTIQTTS